MSHAYISEPPTKGKVVIKTTLGPLEVELWPKEAPKACRNFVQLCLEGYYDGTIFHRVIKKFIVQGGDPTGTGDGGESIYGKPFSNEYHSRLRFSHRGILAMANTGEDDNRSQFFFTFDKADDLNRKNTIFGKVVGDTIYNLLKFNDLEVDVDDKPNFPPRILSVDVLYNPFDDIEPRTTPEEVAAAKKKAEKVAQEQAEAARRPKGKKNVSLLSFGEDEKEEEEMPKTKTKIRSSHDVLTDDPRLSKASVDQISKKDGLPVRTANPPPQPSSPSAHVVAEEIGRKRKAESIEKAKIPRAETQVKESNMDVLQSEIQKLQGEIRSIDSARKPQEEKKPAPTKKVKLMAAIREDYLHSDKVVTLRNRKKNGDDKTLNLLEKFQKKLQKSHQDPGHSEKLSQEKVEDGQECDLHFVINCESCRDSFGAKDEGDEQGWMATSLVFQKEKGANVYEPKVDDYTVIDPRTHGDLDEKKGQSSQSRNSNREPSRRPRGHSYNK
ncbi:cyclophilin-like domain-containing protein [Phlyctochytrium arcticum]|nr:cyclophilin-like domain-containing protein [Phlyctochytrium arcticum]